MKKRRMVIVLAAGSIATSIALASCTLNPMWNAASDSVTSGAVTGVVGAAPAPAADVVREDAASVTATQVPDGKQLIKSASATLGVADLDSARVAVQEIVAAAGGTVTYEAVAYGQDGLPQPMMDGGMYGTYPGPWYDHYVDMAMSVPVTRYEQVMRQLRTLGDVVNVQQSITDVTTQVVDTAARIKAAQASVDRIQVLFAQAKTLQEVVLLEQELTTRQGNLDALVAQQQALAGQVADATISVRLVPQELVDAQASGTSDGTLWERIVTTFVKVWTGLAIVLVAASPLILIALIVVLVVRRTRRRRTDQVDVSEPSA